MRFCIILLSIFLFAFASAVYGAAMPANYSLQSNASLTVPANIKWTNSSIYVNASDYLIISSTGRWRYDPRPQFEVGPEGLKDGLEMPLGALVGKIGDEKPFVIGEQWEGESSYEGWLMLGMHDTTDYENNAGNLTVSIELHRQVKEQGSVFEEPAKTNETSGSANETAEKEGEKRKEEQLCISLFILFALIGVFLFLNKSF